MKKLLIGFGLVMAVMAMSGCSNKPGCTCKPALPDCAPAPVSNCK